jgi:hypothetical protein
MPNSYWGMGNCARLPSIENYGKAKIHYDSVVPIRGRNPEVRPLGSVRRFAWYQVKKNQRVVDDGFLGQYITTYSCNLYGTDCVEFFPDGNIAIRTMGWHTPTTMAFINYVTQSFGHIESVSGKWYWKQNHDGKMFPVKRHRDARLILKPNEEGRMEVDNPVVEKKHAINRKAMNAVRKKYDFFRDYCYVMLSMNPSISKEEYEGLTKDLHLSQTDFLSNYTWNNSGVDVNAGKQNRERFFEQLDKVKADGDIDLMYSLAIVMCYSFGSWSYRTNTATCKPEAFNRQWAEVLKYQFFNEVMVANDVDVGVGFKDRNMKYA